MFRLARLYLSLIHILYLAKYFLHKIFDTIHKKSLHKHILPADSHYIITILSSEAVSYTHLLLKIHFGSQSFLFILLSLTCKQVGIMICLIFLSPLILSLKNALFVCILVRICFLCR